MRNAALLLGVIAGVIGMIVGFFSYGYVSFIDWFGPVKNMAEQVQNPALIETTSLAAPILAIAGAALARARALLGGVLLLVSAAGMYYAFSFNVFTMFPIGMAAVAGVLALSAGAAKLED